jgi:glycosyltransferase involved in cell wall biosynthesis
VIADVIIPALDEQDTVGAVVAAVRSQPVRRVVVVDNGSRDGTAERAASAGADVVTEPRRGYGAACLCGLAHLERGAAPDAVLFLEADGSDDPTEIPRLLAALESHDLVLGSRTQGGAERGALTPAQRAGNAVVTAAIRLLYGRRFTDLGPFRAVRFEALRRMRIRDRGYGFTVEMQVKALRLGLRVAEIPVRRRRRAGGSSKVSGTLRGVVGAGTKIVYTVLRHAVG